MELEQIVSTNLIALRKKHEWTQAELADKINYSDKSVSKWERGEALPDLKVLTKLAELFGVTVDYFLTENASAAPEKFTSPALRRRYQYWIISLFVCLIWLVAISFYVFLIIKSDLEVWKWQIFVWALPATFLALVIFDYRFFGRRLFVIFASLFCWALITAFFVEFWYPSVMWILYLVGVPLQAIIVLMDQMCRTRKNR